jgi:hypothetical protein
MYKTLVVAFFLLLSSTPSVAKSHDIFPVSCDVLWAAVMDTLGNANDFNILVVDDAGQKASFVVVGETTPYKDMVALAAHDSGCAMKLTILQVGTDNSDERGFRNRLNKSLAKLQAAKPAKPAGATGQE